MKVLLVAPKLSNNEMWIPLPLGVVSIASYLHEKGYNIKVYDHGASDTRFAEVIKEYDPDIIGISVVASKSLKDAIRLSKTAKRKNKYVVWGGAFASSIPNVILKENYVDCVIVGEGEKTWEELITAKENNQNLASVDGLVFKSSGEIIETPERALMCGTELPAMNYSFINPSDYFFPFYNCERVSWVCDGKGCFGKCTFCYNQKYNKGKYRKRSYDDITKEIRTLVEDHGADGIYFSDELWCKNQKEMFEQCNAIRALNLNFVWGCFMRVGILSEEDYRYMYESGCRWICFGIESGSPERHKTIKKGIRYETIIPSVKSCYKSGIVPWLSFIAGFPDENPEELRQTMEMVKTLRHCGRVNINAYKPYVGSEMYNALLERGKIKPIKKLKQTKDKLSSEWIVVGENYSDLPTLHLKVVMAFSYYWSYQVRPFSVNTQNEKHSVQKKMNLSRLISGIINTIKGMGFVYLLQTGLRFLSILFFVTMFPHINKKYSLSIKDK